MLFMHIATAIALTVLAVIMFLFHSETRRTLRNLRIDLRRKPWLVENGCPIEFADCFFREHIPKDERDDLRMEFRYFCPRCETALSLLKHEGMCRRCRMTYGVLPGFYGVPESEELDLQRKYPLPTKTMRLSDPINYACPLCCQTFATRSELANHNCPDNEQQD